LKLKEIYSRNIKQTLWLLRKGSAIWWLLPKPMQTKSRNSITKVQINKKKLKSLDWSQWLSSLKRVQWRKSSIELTICTWKCRKTTKSKEFNTTWLLMRFQKLTNKIMIIEAWFFRMKSNRRLLRRRLWHFRILSRLRRQPL